MPQLEHGLEYVHHDKLHNVLFSPRKIEIVSSTSGSLTPTFETTL